MVFVILSCLKAENISLEYNSSVSFGRIFQINLTLINFTTGMYDIKIDIYNQTTSNRLSEMYNGTSWKSTNYYFNNATNTSLSNTSSFLLNITENYNGTANVTISIKKGSSISTFTNYFINITPDYASSVNTTTPTTTTSNATKAVYIELDWEDDEILNSGEEFEIEIKAYYLLDEKYDVKVWIEDDDENVLSERYGIYADEDAESWKSGNYYAVEFLNGDSNRTKNIKLRLKSSYNDYHGEATIKAKIRESDSETEKDSFEKSIDILETNSTETPTIYENFSSESALTASASSNADAGVIVLGKTTNKTETSGKSSNSIIYKSKSEYIKEYAPYAFGILCIIIIILLIIDNKKHGK